MTSGTLAAGKAYLELPKSSAGSRALRIAFAGVTTGINAVETAVNDNTVYNLNGQRVALPAKGLFIVNGKKVIRK